MCYQLSPNKTKPTNPEGNPNSNQDAFNMAKLQQNLSQKNQAPLHSIQFLMGNQQPSPLGTGFQHYRNQQDKFNKQLRQQHEHQLRHQKQQIEQQP